ncbi:DUF4865 family protein [Sneathiella litorea]|uniref:DUF4865 family protein n=1 Tax=Sneathiella litorea TaxID=2606216 RepID=A0A6L8W7G2_9PROT|nr:DUF4865 family protein [Sneathiella litorea]MZR31041.1 DUF4865 family protein [Sneathiella litorea]
MLAMQYSVRLPQDFDETQIHKHVAARSRLFEGCPGLRHKFYLYDVEEHVYAPFYIWENAQFAQDFLLNNLFNGVTETFGRPRVRSWQVIAFDYGPAKEDPTYLCSAVDKVSASRSLGEMMEAEKKHHKSLLEAPGLYAHMVLLDPDRWEKGLYSLWQTREQAVPVKSDCVSDYDVLESYRQMQGAA